MCDLSDIASVRRAAAEIIAFDLPIAGLLNNAGILPTRATKNALGWDMTFATNHLGPFALTEALVPHLPDGTNVVFVASGVEDPGRKPAVAAGFRGGRYISAEASVRGEWKPDGSIANKTRTASRLELRKYSPLTLRRGARGHCDACPCRSNPSRLFTG
jgi:NAD(P)-dependent dehydrogenase (short-subunit alcohol dehydrogenase family)